MENIKIKITEFINNKYNGSYRFIKEKMFISEFGNKVYEEILNNTIFLENTKYAFSVKVRSYIEGISQNPVCKVCGKMTIFNSNNGWQATCSRICHIRSSERMEKLKETNLSKYGNTNYLASEEGKRRTKKSNMERYGVDNYAKSEEFKNKFKK